MLNEKETMLISSIVRRIKELRYEHNVSQLDVYYSTNLHISRIERGKEDIKISSIQRLCDYFGISLEEFFKDIR